MPKEEDAPLGYPGNESVETNAGDDATQGTVADVDVDEVHATADSGGSSQSEQAPQQKKSSDS